MSDDDMEPGAHEAQNPVQGGTEPSQGARDSSLEGRAEPQLQ